MAERKLPYSCTALKRKMCAKRQKGGDLSLECKDEQNLWDTENTGYTDFSPGFLLKCAFSCADGGF
ncbi:MAG: hypothetical protein DDG60_03275 [Anaerolineae bacterium]|nr:MAG: hypothetical protein DDG60_03275 [Anaerolineae bacterium]